NQQQVADFSVPYGTTVGDYNQDSYPDMLVPYNGCHTPCSGIAVFKNNHNNTFSTDPASPWVGDGGPIYIYGPTVAADLNGDGRKDLSIGVIDYGPTFDNPRTAAAIWRRLSNGTYTFIDFPVSGSNIFNYPSGMAAGDFNRDGKQDIAMTTHPGPNAVFIL